MNREGRTPAVFPLVSTAAGLGRWWAEDVWETDGAVDLSFFARRTIDRIRLVRESPPLAAEWKCETPGEWHDTRMVFRMESAGAGVLVYLIADWHAETDYFAICNTSWGELMYRLTSAAQGNEPGSPFLKDGMAVSQSPPTGPTACPLAGCFC